MEVQKDDERREVFSRKWTLIVCVCCIPVFMIVTYFGDAGRGRAAAISTGTLLVAARLNWRSRAQMWFWVGTAALVALHAYLILAFQWTSRSYPGPSLLPIALVDYGFDYGMLKLAKIILLPTVKLT